MKNVSILLYDPTCLEPSYMAEDEVLTLGDLTVAEILIVSRQYRLGMHLLVDPQPQLKSFVNIYVAQLNGCLHEVARYNPWFWDDYAHKELEDFGNNPRCISGLSPEAYLEFCDDIFNGPRPLSCSIDNNSLRVHFGFIDHQPLAMRLFNGMIKRKNPYYGAYLRMIIGHHSGKDFSPHTEFVQPDSIMHPIRGWKLLDSLTANGRTVLFPEKPKPPAGVVNRIIFNPDLKSRKLINGTLIVDNDDPAYVMEFIGSRLQRGTSIEIISSSSKRHPYHVGMIRSMMNGRFLLNVGSYMPMLAEKVPVYALKFIKKPIDYKTKSIPTADTLVPFFDNKGHLVYDSLRPWQLLEYDFSDYDIDVLNRMRSLMDFVKMDTILFRYIMLGFTTYDEIVKGSAYPCPTGIKDNFQNFWAFPSHRVFYF